MMFRHGSTFGRERVQTEKRKSSMTKLNSMPDTATPREFDNDNIIIEDSEATSIDRLEDQSEV